MKKGFTLVELLAVIIVIGVVITIVSVEVTNIIDESAEKSFFTSAKAIARQLEYEYLGSNEDISFSLRDSNLKDISLTDYDLDSSRVYIEEGQVYLNLVGLGSFEGMYLCGFNTTVKNVTVSYNNCASGIYEK